MILAVFDCNVVIGATWSGPNRLALAQVARRRVRGCLTEDILAEYRATARRLHEAGILPSNPAPLLGWIERSFRLVAPAPLGKRRSRDPDDDYYLAAALGAGARFVVSNDKDLLALGKPLGIEVLKPAAFVQRVQVD